MEYVSGGCIAGLLQNYGAFEDEVAQHYVRQLLFGRRPLPFLLLFPVLNPRDPTACGPAVHMREDNGPSRMRAVTAVF